MNKNFASIRWFAGGVAMLLTGFTATPAMAHHPFGGEAPQNIAQGIVSGIGHPVLGLDHLAFIITIGLLAAVLRRGFTVPLSFLIAALVGTGIHLNGLDLPATELAISTSVLIFGALATMGRRLSTSAVVGLAVIAGVFHGYAYGEAVVGAEPTPLIAYLVGFSFVQGAIALIAYLFSKRAVSKDQTAGLISVRNAGFVVCGAGAAFLGNLLV